HLLLYSLLYATLGSFATNVTTKMLLVLYNWKELERALSYVELMAEPEKRAYAFLTLGCHSEPFDLIGGMERRGKPDGGLLKRAFQEAQDIEDIEKRAHFLSSLAPELARAGEVEAAFAAAELIDR